MTEIILTVEDQEAVTLTVEDQEAVTLTVDEGEAMAIWNLDIVRGQSTSHLLTFTNPDGSAFDLDGATIYWAAKRRESDKATLIEKDSTDPAEIEIQVPANAGQALFFLATDDTKDLEPGRLVHDLWIRKATGELLPVVSVSPLTLAWEVKRF